MNDIEYINDEIIYKGVPLTRLGITKQQIDDLRMVGSIDIVCMIESEYRKYIVEQRDIKINQILE